MIFTRINDLTITGWSVVKGTLIVVLLASLLFSVIIWRWPIKRTLDNSASLSDYANGKIALICEAGGNTGPSWRITQFMGIEDIAATDIDISGFTPDKALRNPLYMYMNSKFLFVGEFSKTEISVFVVD